MVNAANAPHQAAPQHQAVGATLTNLVAPIATTYGHVAQSR